jgi:hypothetical protein
LCFQICCLCFQICFLCFQICCLCFQICFLCFLFVIRIVLLLIVLFYVLFVLFVCKCVLHHCHRVSTQLQLTNISTTFFRSRYTSQLPFICTTVHRRYHCSLQLCQLQTEVSAVSVTEMSYANN